MRCLALFVLLLGIACSSPTLPEERALSLAQAKWSAHGFVQYEMEIRVSCFCPPELTEWSRVRVVDDRVAGVLRLSDSTTYSADRWPMWPTITEIFSRLEEVRSSEVHARFEATFDPDLGFPVEASLIAREGIADAGVAWSIRELRPLGASSLRPGR